MVWWNAKVFEGTRSLACCASAIGLSIALAPAVAYAQVESTSESIAPNGSEPSDPIIETHADDARAPRSDSESGNSSPTDDAESSAGIGTEPDTTADSSQEPRPFDTSNDANSDQAGASSATSEADSTLPDTQAFDTKSGENATDAPSEGIQCGPEQSNATAQPSDVISSSDDEHLAEGASQLDDEQLPASASQPDDEQPIPTSQDSSTGADSASESSRNALSDAQSAPVGRNQINVRDSTATGSIKEEDRIVISTASPAAPVRTKQPAKAVVSSSVNVSATSASTSESENPWKGGHWLSKGGKLYWCGKDGKYAKGMLILPEWGAGFYAYARPNGRVVLRKWTNGTVVYLANGKGKLLSPGWHVTDAYTEGTKQRYYIDPELHGAVIGYHKAKGDVWAHYTRKAGYVVRGKYKASSTKTYVANKKGKLMSNGWHVAASYDASPQRYYVRNGAAVTGAFSVKGKHYYGIPGKGYVLRGTSKKYLAVASNTGVLKTNQWLVTDAFGHGVQRYWLGKDGLAIRDAFTSPKKAGYRAYARSEGYVVRGIYCKGKRVWLANNDGKLMSDGWHVTAAYDLEAGEQRRYYIDPKTHSAQVGYSTEGGFAHFGVPGMGYVLEADACKSGKWVYVATKKGRLPKVKKEGWVVTSAYGRDNEVHRYYFEKTSEGVWAARSGISTKGGWTHYTHPDTGYVSVNSWVYLKSRGGWCQTSSKGKLSAAKDVRDKLVGAFVDWAVGIANDNSHGYSQKHRWGPEDYDCSSLVISAIRAAGIHPGRAVYTGNMRKELGPRGFEIVPFSGTGNLRYGDILLNDITHTEIYIGGGRNVGAHCDENGGIEGRQRGDQTGREICVGSYHNANWGWVLRIKH